MGRTGNSKGKKWVWVVGWILIFPLPLTILICRSQIDKKVKTGVIIAGWVAYGIILAKAPKDAAQNNDKVVNNTASIQEDNTSTTKSTGTNKKTDLTPTPSPTPTPVIEVESIEIVDEFEELGLGDTSTVHVKIEPENATDKGIQWESTDDNIISINDKGFITATGGGKAIITASTSNGKSASIELSVDDSKRTMKLNVSRQKTDNNNIGKEWWTEYKINGERTFGGEYTLKVGDKISLYAKVVEEDENPDIGENKKTYTVTKEDLLEGFSVSMEVKVRENGGIYRGVETVWEVSFRFGPKGVR